MPLVGLGCWKIEGDVAKETIRTAIKLGYRHFDCAADCKNFRKFPVKCFTTLTISKSVKNLH